MQQKIKTKDIKVLSVWIHLANNALYVFDDNLQKILCHNKYGEWTETGISIEQIGKDLEFEKIPLLIGR